MKTGNALAVVAIALAGLGTVSLPNASAEMVKVEEFYGIGFRGASVARSAEIISDCGDDDPSTDMLLQTSTGTVTYTGIMEGSGEVLTRGIVDRCVTGHVRTTFRVLDTFASLRVAGRTGGAVVEIVGRGSAPAPGVALNETRIRILCGTGELRHVHGEGTQTGSASPTGASTGMQLWVHFGHNHDVGFDFLCRDLPGGSDD